MKPNYIDKVREALRKKFLVKRDPIPEELLDLYTLLVFVKGDQVTNENIHDAWAIWRSRTFPHHKHIIPFDKLEEKIQKLDEPYRKAVSEVAQEMLKIGRERPQNRRSPRRK